ncbi:hypothetical protein NWI01_33130 [Nitrobacter winogradskyi]|uniref:Uncharacterized protein n=1 Tax=Nitrobacter winogradskyi TaxID=913 RepID=A0A4Y3WGV9_NITWI|nr:hypothetical protein [Nitrobacter winogradskyi]GEC17421.1 hypothetical protein NWI01_33130 [Nitrobacter winogradskyi]
MSGAGQEDSHVAGCYVGQPLLRSHWKRESQAERDKTFRKASAQSNLTAYLACIVCNAVFCRKSEASF